MRVLRSTKPLINPLLLLLLLVLLSSMGVLLFNFYGMKSADEIATRRRRVENAVFRTCLREMQRIALVIPVLKQQDDEEERGLRRELEKASLIFSPEGELPHIVSSLGYRKAESSDRLFTYAAGGSWEETELPIRDTVRKRVPKIDPGETLILRAGEEEARQLILLHRPLENGDFYIQATMDMEGIREAYIEPAIREILEDYELEWKRSEVGEIRSVPPLEEGEERRDPFLQDYRFSPLKALSGRAYKLETRLEIRLPYLIFPAKPIPLNEDQSARGEESPDRISELFDLPLLRQSRSLENGEELRLLAGRRDGPFYLEIERKNAIDWMQSMLILLGIGGIFLILLLQQTRLRQLREKEREFVASISHELRTPLTVIRSASDNLGRGIIPPERLPGYASLIREQVIRLGTMIEEILMFSSMGGRVGSADPVELDLPALLEELRASARAVASERGITLHWDDKGLPRRGLGDPEMIRLGVNNLILNGLIHAYPEACPKASAAAGPKGLLEAGAVGEPPAPIRPLRLRARFSIPSTLEFTVEDEGRGVSRKEQRRIFEPFYRDGISRQNQEKGSGLGLFILKKKSAAAGGALRLESPYTTLKGERRQGCRFVLTLPFHPETEDGNG